MVDFITCIYHQKINIKFFEMSVIGYQNKQTTISVLLWLCMKCPTKWLLYPLVSNYWDYCIMRLLTSSIRISWLVVLVVAKWAVCLVRQGLYLAWPGNSICTSELIPYLQKFICFCLLRAGFKDVGDHAQKNKITACFKQKGNLRGHNT